MRKLRALSAIGGIWLWLLAPALAANQASVVTPTSGPMSASTFTSTYLNPALLAIFTCNWGPAAPANGPGGVPAFLECWADTTTNPVVFKRYDGASWVIFGKLDQTAHSWNGAFLDGANIFSGANSFTQAITLTNVVAPATPAAGKTAIYVDSTDKRLHDKNDAGTIGTTVVPSSAAANQFATAISAAGVVTYAQPSAANLSNGTTGSGAVVLANTPSLTTPNIGAAIGTSLALGGATLGANTLAVTGSAAISGALTSGAQTITSASGSCLAIGPNGATNSALNVGCATASLAAGLNIIGAPTGGTVTITLTDPGANTNVTISAKGTGTMGIGTSSTGAVTITPALILSSTLALGGTVSGGGNQINNVIIGSVTPLAGSFTTLSASSTVSGAGFSTYLASPPAIGGTAPAAGAFTTLTASTPMGVASGGSGAGTFTAHGVLLGEGTSAFGVLAGTGGNSSLPLISQGASLDPVYSQIIFAAISSSAIATQANYFAGAASVLVPASQIYQPEITTTFAAAQTIDFNTFINTAITLTATMTSMTLSNVTAGKAGQIRFVQDGTGSRTFTGTWPSAFKWVGGTTPVLSTAANASDNLQYSCSSSTYCTASLAKDVR